MNRHIFFDDIPSYEHIEFLGMYSKYRLKHFWYLNYDNGMNYYIQVAEDE